ncbi:Sulfotransferase family protein [Pseudomonas sp. IT-P74]|uniref:sulfotransferase family protein n=1 Tax=unclassified Pseudomonas TaxID=196821 RepID=UPI000BB3AA40|nr:sulfotransferase [Pseudomonas sp. ACN8]PBJ19830.1 Sulfotransferase domain protein [Pseudomonas sp. ACN8]
MSVQPIFVIGSYRSATSLMGWVLGQHSNIFPLEETHYIYKMSTDAAAQHDLGTKGLARSFLLSANISRRSYCIAAGVSCNDLILKSRSNIVENAAQPQHAADASEFVKFSTSPDKKRWLDATPENAHFVYSLLRMFPNAKFIHILRNPKLVASSLMNFSGVGANDYEEENAYNTWTRLVTACQLAEKAFGTDVVKRIYYDDIVANPEQVVRECLEFVGEAYQADCLGPFSLKVNSSKHKQPMDISIEGNINDSRLYVRKAFLLYQQLLQDKEIAPRGDLEALRLCKSQDADYIFSRSQKGIADYNANVTRLYAENQRLKAESVQLKSDLMRASLEVIDWGPKEIYAGQPFNAQANGASALWLKVRGVVDDVQVELGGNVLPAVLSKDFSVITLEVLPSLTCTPCSMPLVLKSKASGDIVGGIELSILPVAEDEGHAFESLEVAT